MSVSKEQKIETPTCLKWAIGAFSIVILINLFVVNMFISKINAKFEDYSLKQAILVQTIQGDIETQQNAKPDDKNIKPISFRADVEQAKKDDYQDFLMHYYDTQCFWLTTWLTMLVVILGVMAIAVPIIFADRRKELDDAIKTIAKLKDEADVDAKLEKFAKGLEEVKEYVEKAQESEKKAEASKLFTIAYQYQKEDNYTLALADYNKAIELDSNFKETYNNRSNVYFVQKNYTLALADCNKAIELDSNYKSAYIGRGRIHYEQGNYTSAFADYNKAIELDSKHKNAYNGRSLVYIKLGEFEQAIKDLTKAIKLDSNFSTAYYNLTEAYIFDKQFDKALDILNLFLQKEPIPFIYKDDYENWMRILNECSEDSNVLQIKEIMDTNLTRKDRE